MSAMLSLRSAVGRASHRNFPRKIQHVLQTAQMATVSSLDMDIDTVSSLGIDKATGITKPVGDLSSVGTAGPSSSVAMDTYGASTCSWDLTFHRKESQRPVARHRQACILMFDCLHQSAGRFLGTMATPPSPVRVFSCWTLVESFLSP